MRKRSMAAAVTTATALLVPALVATPASAASSFRLFNEQSWKCLTTNSTADKKVAEVDNCGSSAYTKKVQSFQVIWYNHLKNVYSGKCLEINPGSNKKVNSGDYVYQRPCKKTAPNQKWDIGPSGRVVVIQHIRRAGEPYVFLTEKGAARYSKVIVQTQPYPVPDRQIWDKA